MYELSIKMIDSPCNWDDSTPDVEYNGSPVSGSALSIASL